MIRSVKYMVAAGIIAAFAGGAQAAPPPIGDIGMSITDGLVKIHGEHRRCERGRNGIWHRHNRDGDRRPCREWRGDGRRPDSCVRFGPVWFCDY